MIYEGTMWCNLWCFEQNFIVPILELFFDRNKTLYDTIDGAITHLKHEKWNENTLYLQNKFIFHVDI